MNRRAFIAALGGVAAAWPLVTRSQQSAMPVIGFLRSASLDNTKSLITAFRQGLKETGYVEGQNVVIEFRSAEGHNDLLPGLAAELTRLPVAVIVGNVTSAFAAKTVTTKVPIVFAAGDDPIASGLVTSLNRPGGNITGVSFLGNTLGGKQLELVRELVPNAMTIAVLLDTNDPASVPELKDVQVAAHALGQQRFVPNIKSERDLEMAAETLAQQRVDALLSNGAAFFLSRRDQIVGFAARRRVPAIYNLREYVAAGGLMSYGASITDAYRLAGIYTGKILNGANPADIPVQQSMKIELVLNLKTAKALGLTIPPSILVRADEVIE
jgi:putative ABC transport system substrate-binding protein